MVEDSERDEGVSRRKVLKGAAAAGAVVWATPVIQTINAASARAQATPPPGEEVCYSVKFNTSGVCEEGGSYPGGCMTPEALSDCSFISSTPRTPPDDSGTMTVTLDADCRLVEGFSKCSSDLCNPPSSLGGNMYLFSPCPDPDPPPAAHGISHLQITFCCPPNGE